MNKIVILLICIFSFGASAQNFWTDAETGHIFELLSQNPATAVSEVESYGVNPFDFGMDLVAMEQNDAAFLWFVTLAQRGEDTRNYLLGMAWVQMENQNLGGAMTAANMILASNGPQLSQARTHYMLGVIFKYVGSVDLAYIELTAAEELYQELGKQGGVALCQDVLFDNKSATSTVEEMHSSPTRDDALAVFISRIDPTQGESQPLSVTASAPPPRHDIGALVGGMSTFPLRDLSLPSENQKMDVTITAPPPRDDIGALVEGMPALPLRDEDDTLLDSYSNKKVLSLPSESQKLDVTASAPPPRHDIGA